MKITRTILITLIAFFGTVFLASGIVGLWAFCFGFAAVAAQAGSSAAASFVTLFSLTLLVSFFPDSNGSTYL